MDSFIEFLIANATDGDGLEKYFTQYMSSLSSIAFQTANESLMMISPVRLIIDNALHYQSIKNRIREAIIDNIISVNRFTITDTSPVWVYLAIHG